MLFGFTCTCLAFFVFSIISSESLRNDRDHARTKTYMTTWFKRLKVVKGDSEGQVYLGSGLGARLKGQAAGALRAKEENKESHGERSDDKEQSDGAFYTPGKKGTENSNDKLQDVENKTTKIDRKSGSDRNEASDGALYILGKKSEDRKKGSQMSDANDESDGALFIPGKKSKDNKRESHTSDGDGNGNDESDGALFIPGKKSENSNKGGRQTSDGDDDGNDSDGALFIPWKKSDSDASKKSEGTNEEIASNKFGREISYAQENIVTSWPLGIIPYYFDMTFFDHVLASRVRESIDIIEGASCVQFKPLTVKPEEKHNWIHITNPTRQRECMHRAMHQSNGEIRMILGLGCLKRRDILHTLLHAMGFMDEVSHPHRDQYIHVMWNNIQPKYQSLFSTIGEGSTIQVEYDPMSIMHFHERAFSKNGQATIVPLMPGLQIQPSDKLSQLDKMKLRLAFGHECNRRSVDHIMDTCKVVLSKTDAVTGDKVKDKEVNNDKSQKREEEQIEKAHEEKRKEKKEHVFPVLESEENNIESSKSNENHEDSKHDSEKENLFLILSWDVIKTRLEQVKQKSDTDRLVLIYPGRPGQCNENHIMKGGEKNYTKRPLIFPTQFNKSIVEVKQDNDKQRLFFIPPGWFDNSYVDCKQHHVAKGLFHIFSGHFNKSRVEGKQENDAEQLFLLYPGQFNDSYMNGKQENIEERLFFIHPGLFNKSPVKNKQENVKEQLFLILPWAAINKSRKEVKQKNVAEHLFLIYPGQLDKSRGKQENNKEKLLLITHWADKNKSREDGKHKNVAERLFPGWVDKSHVNGERGNDKEQLFLILPWAPLNNSSEEGKQANVAKRLFLFSPKRFNKSVESNEEQKRGLFFKPQGYYNKSRVKRKWSQTTTLSSYKTIKRRNDKKKKYKKSRRYSVRRS